jgi:hypothetical protein
MVDSLLLASGPHATILARWRPEAPAGAAVGLFTGEPAVRRRVMRSRASVARLTDGQRLVAMPGA